MIQAGMNIARLGLAHGSHDEAQERVELIRRIAAEEKTPVGILIDLPGPKVRSANFGQELVTFAEGSKLTLRVGNHASTAQNVEVDYAGLISDIDPGDVVSIGDGRVMVKILEATDDQLNAEVAHGGTLSGRPGIHIPSERLSLVTPTPEDMVAVERFAALKVDMLAVSFVRSAADLVRLGTPSHPEGPLVIAKIETAEAIKNLPEIIEASGAVMVARGDLGLECGIEGLPSIQKHIIRECIALGRPAITATQMLETMVENPEPTRAEVSDVANAVWDGSSAVMLSGETAIGVDPVNVIATMARIVDHADQDFDHRGWADDLAEIRLTDRKAPETSITDAMTLATARAVNELGIKTVLCISGSGFTVRSMARFRPKARILGYSANENTVGQLSLSWGTEPRLLPTEGPIEGRIMAAVNLARDSGDLQAGELVAVLAGTSESSRSTNVLRIQIVPTVK
jgi:pyruvate kinase